jgi:hypothetical protein
MSARGKTQRALEIAAGAKNRRAGGGRNNRHQQTKPGRDKHMIRRLLTTGLSLLTAVVPVRQIDRGSHPAGEAGGSPPLGKEGQGGCAAVCSTRDVHQSPLTPPVPKGQARPSEKTDGLTVATSVVLHAALAAWCIACLRNKRVNGK